MSINNLKLVKMLSNYYCVKKTIKIKAVLENFKSLRIMFNELKYNKITKNVAQKILSVKFLFFSNT